jgi:cholesterol transport system auxiliary component
MSTTPTHCLRALAAAAGLAISLAGCLMSSARPQEIATYALEPPPVAAAPAAALDWQLLVERPLATEPLAGMRLAVRDRDRAYGVLHGVRWSQRAPELVQTLLVRRLEDSGRMRGVARPGAGIRADYVLLTELRAFEANYGSAAAAPVVRFVLGATLVRSGRHEVVATRVFSEQAMSGGGSAPAIVAAFDQAAGRLLMQLEGWVLERGERDWRRSPAPVSGGR